MIAMTISALAQRSGVSASTLRYYEGLGLLPATSRTAAGYRLYDDHASQRLAFIEAAKRLQLSLSCIKELLTAWETDACRSVKTQLRTLLDERIAGTDAAIADLNALRHHLAVARSHLDELPDRDERCDPGCAFLLDQRSSTSATHSATECSLPDDQYHDRTRKWQLALRDCPRSLIEGGVRVLLPIDRAATITELVLAEQNCCAAIAFALSFADSTLTMTVVAPPEAQSVLSDIMGDLGAQDHA